MIHIELRHLRYFVAVAEELSFARAAERLHISQPPLTRQIRQLETKLGVQLFDRTTRQVRLTEAGRVYLQEARSALAQIDQGARRAQSASRGKVGQLIVGFEGSSVYDIVTQSLTTFRNHFPDVELSLLEMNTDDQAQALRQCRIGAGFLVPPVHDETLAFETIMSEPLVVALPQDHPFYARNEIALRDLANESFVMSSRSKQCGLHHQVITVCRGEGFSPKVVQEANEMQIMLGFIAAGLGVSLLPEHVKLLHKPGVVYRRVIPCSARVELALAWRRDDLSPILGEFLQAVRQYVQSDLHPQA